MSNSADAIQYADDELKQDRELALIALTQDAYVLRFLDHFKGDRELVMQFMVANSYILEFVSDELKADKEVVLCAIGSRGGVHLRFVDEALRNDRRFGSSASQRF